ncbi:patatin-like phospholipase family protein [Polaribacter glomeratus]|uniref:PNPLA domain-containing protein n=1 Tax=Polaribacter glomeratus TaxID=102 RepID=A0A2S7WFW7_9FLAO|nr:patatin-like phospholipase family protein [Polaribacter glomeratus]PQJ76513.1 hypothetical protein BTO16_11450 [Polaribacter glomeratus]TXD64189.1 patatin-like phospholipase family protein [Polaribacter glomeratus]
MKKVFTNIALAFSGGGFRAASFTLGTLSLFERVGLLSSVKAISSVSGGSITAVKYAQSQIEGLGFDEFFLEYYAFLKKDDLADLAFQNLRKGKFCHKRANPINAFALEYNKLTNHKSFADLDDAIENNKTHLKRLIINATSFNDGLSFRFQNTRSNRFDFGNGELDKKYKKYYNHIKLGDALAASSAFPGGFEPILFPHDFTVVDDKELIPISLMDGGIIDNQGTSSFLSGSAFSNNVDLFFIADVSSPYMEELKPTKRNFITFLISFLFSVPMLLLFGIGVIWSYRLESKLIYSLFFVVFAFLTSIQILLFFAAKKIKAMTGSRFKFELPSMSLGIFLLDRINSLIHMAAEVSLKGFRRLNSKAIYKKYWNKTVSSMIYELRCLNEDQKPENGTHWEPIKNDLGEIPENIKELSKKATEFGTTLWFNDVNGISKPTIDTLIACGEVTACFNLLSYLIVHKKDEIKNVESSEHELYRNLKKLWNDFTLDPYMLVNLIIKPTSK